MNIETDKEILIEVLQIYADNIMRRSAYWNYLNTHVYIVDDISEHEVSIEFSFTHYKTKYLKSFRRIGMSNVIKQLDKQLQIKKKYKTYTLFKQVFIATSHERSIGSKGTQYGDCLVKYNIPRDLYDQLKMLVKIDKDYIIRLSTSRSVL